MFQRLSNLLFGEVEEVAAELKGPGPCVTDADEEGWMLVSLTGESVESLELILTQTCCNNYNPKFETAGILRKIPSSSVK